VESGRIHRTVISLAGPATDRTPRMTDLLLTFMFRRAHIVQWLPILRVAMLIYDERFGPRRQNMQRLQEFDDDVLQVGGQGVERLSLPQSFTIVCFDGFPGRGELPVVHECPTPVIEAPEFTRDEFAVPRKNPSEPAGWFWSRGSHSGSVAASLVLLISWSLRSV
jgi:hypothetical protein